MSILIGILLYVLLIAWLCALTGINRLDGARPHATPVSKATKYPARVAAPEAQG